MIATLIPIPKENRDQQAILSLMRQHGLHEWQLRVTRTMKYVGECRYKEKTISLSVYQPDGCWLDTLMHEIAHALTPHERGHGPAWRAKCVEIGAVPLARALVAYHPDITYSYACSGCKKIIKRSPGRLRRPERLMSLCCRADIFLAKEPVRCS